MMALAGPLVARFQPENQIGRIDSGPVTFNEPYQIIS
jgi:hypothetical protein